MTIRLARSSELSTIGEIERAAGVLFAEIDMAPVAFDEPMTIEELEPFLANGRLWVAVDADDQPIGYACAAEVDGVTHLEQVSVHPAYGRSGIGTALINTVIDNARTSGSSAVTLTTFVDVPWNGPYYRRLGFEFLTTSSETPGLRAIRAAEADHGLDRWPRACMRLDLD
ncbi:GNAT family N-acetyltransferase [Gordonia malaquae]|uniref:GNAT family N-acetyltransferase n=1 Tax=Gordonia malaquae TaxID=410332 RepID=UPI0030176DB9